MGKRIRHPKRKEEEIKQKAEEKTEEKKENHYVLDVHNSVIGGKSKIGN
jgi:hypothetical protein